MRKQSEPTVIGLIVNLALLWLAIALVTQLVVALGGMLGSPEILLLTVIGLGGALLLVYRWVIQRQRYREFAKS